MKKSELRQIIKEMILKERELSPLQQAYSEFFFSMLDEFGVKSPAELSDDKKSEFFDRVKKDWKKKKVELAKQGIGPVNEGIEIKIPNGVRLEMSRVGTDSAAFAKWYKSEGFIEYDKKTRRLKKKDGTFYKIHDGNLVPAN